MNTPVLTNRYKNHRFPAEIISHGVWLYFRFCLSYRDVEELLFARGIIVTYEAIRKWCRKFGQAYANQLRRRRPRPGDKWHLDEMFLTISGERHYLWRAVDQEGNVLDILVPRRRDRRCEAGDPPGRGPSPASLSQQPCGKLSSAHASAGAAHAGLQVARTGPTVSRRVWSHCATLPPSTASLACPRIPS
jgi:hypothetical protein